MRVLVTGAEGFVGAHLVRELEAHGHQVYGSDKPDADLATPYAAELLVKRSKPEYVVHLAARYGRLLCRDEPHLAVSDNTAGTTELAAACAAKHIPVLYASSSEVYGDHGQDTITEDSELRMPTTIYGLSKRWGEEALFLYLPEDRLTIVRMNMLYGPEQLGGYGRCSLATFIKNALEDRPFEVHRATTRSWLYISDAVRALRLLIENKYHGVYNLGNPADPRPMIDAAEMVRDSVQAFGCRGDYDVRFAPAGQILHKMYDSTKLLNTINWRPEVTLMEGIQKTVEWARTVEPVAA